MAARALPPLCRRAGRIAAWRKIAVIAARNEWRAG